MVLSRRQLRHDRRRRRGGPARLRQHPQVHPLHLRPHDARGDAVRRLRPRRRRDPAPAHRDADARVRHRHRDPARPRPRPRAGRAGPHATTAARAVRERHPDAAMLLRAWLFLGPICAVLAMAGFFYVLLGAGWQPGRPDRRGLAAAPRLPAGDHDDVPRHDRRPDRHRVRRPHRPRLAALDRRVLATACCCGASRSSWPSPRCSSTPRRSRRCSGPPR